MLSKLKFAMGAVAKKDFLPALTHFVIDDGRVRGYNGTLALCSPIPFDISCKPKAEPLVRAIANCTDTVQLSMTPAGRLSIRSGAFKAFVDCIDGDTPHVEPEGEPVELNGQALLDGLKTVAPFIGDDASRPWSNGVLLDGQSLFATNNIILAEYWLGHTFPKRLNVPRACVKEMLRINEAPVSAQVTDNSITFHYSDGRWIRTQLYSVEWPNLAKVLDRPSNPLPIDPRLFTALQSVKPFTDKLGRIFFGDGMLSTHIEPNEGASYEVPELQHEGVYSFEMLGLLDGTVTKIDWTMYPGPCMFFGDRLRGAIIGMHK